MSPHQHDIGGEAAGPIDVVPHDPTFWELRVDALYQLLADSRRKIFKADELRWMRESMAPEDFARQSYYGRWVSAMGRLLLAKNIVTQEELARKMDEIRSRKSAA